MTVPTLSPMPKRISYGHRSGSAQVAVTIIGIHAKSFRGVYLVEGGAFSEDPQGYAASVLVTDLIINMARAQEKRADVEELDDSALSTGHATGLLDAIVALTTMALFNGEHHMATPAREFIREALKVAGAALATEREYAKTMAAQEREEWSR